MTSAQRIDRYKEALDRADKAMVDAAFLQPVYTIVSCADDYIRLVFDTSDANEEGQWHINWVEGEGNIRKATITLNQLQSLRNTLNEWFPREE